MNNLIPLMRSDRLREIIEYEKRSYSFRIGKDKYKYVRTICVNNHDASKFNFEVRVNHVEPRFYIVGESSAINESCIYLSIFDLYLILVEISKEISVDKVMKILISERKPTAKIIYTELEFELNFFSEEIPNGYVKILDSSIKITYENLFILIALIQDKSNYFWSLSSLEKRIYYTEGIIRLLYCLISTRGHEILDLHGWRYNEQSCYYEKSNEKIDFKYYLTDNEFKNIMEVKS